MKPSHEEHVPAEETVTGRPVPWALLSLSLSMLLASLGTSIANVALPTLAQAFNARTVDATLESYVFEITGTPSATTVWIPPAFLRASGQAASSTANPEAAAVRAFMRS